MIIKHNEFFQSEAGMFLEESGIDTFVHYIPTLLPEGYSEEEIMATAASSGKVGMAILFV